eukprot:SAG22_NODE_1910_length_3328_cov_2.639827_3_plen_105_part_00
MFNQDGALSSWTGQASRGITATQTDEFQTISLTLFYERARAMAPNRNEDGVAMADGVAMVDVVIVVDDAPVPDQDDQDNQGAQDGGCFYISVDRITSYCKSLLN